MLMVAAALDQGSITFTCLDTELVDLHGSPVQFSQQLVVPLSGHPLASELKEALGTLQDLMLDVLDLTKNRTPWQEEE